MYISSIYAFIYIYIYTHLICPRVVVAQEYVVVRSAMDAISGVQTMGLMHQELDMYIYIYIYYIYRERESYL